jgi:hypothetical protein
MTEREKAEHNAKAWLELTDRELIERSASLGLDGDLHPEVGGNHGGRLATYGELDQLRANADAVARELTDDEFVDGWIAENRAREAGDLVSF